ncbi:2'-5' RNA ligase family protein [Streptomyces sp. NPDC001205]
MQTFVPSWGDRPWPTQPVLQIYAVPDFAVDPELQELVEACRAAMAPHPIRPTPDPFLHVTLGMVTDATSDQITGSERVTLITSLDKHLAPLAGFRFLAGSPVANGAGAYLDCWPDGELTVLHEAVRSAIRTVRGPASATYVGGRPHIGLGYSWAASDSDPLQSALRAITPSHAPCTVDRIKVVEVTFSPTPIEPTGLTGTEAWDFTFTPVHTIPLTPGASRRPGSTVEK